MTIASVATSEVLLVLKIAFLVLLYLFIWRIVRAAAHEVRTPQESMVLSPEQAAAFGLGRAARADAPLLAHLVVVASPSLEQGARYDVDGRPISAGRGGQNQLALARDEFASAEHARFEPRGQEVWIHDLGSTNGTFVNGIRVARERQLAHGDVVRIGDTELRYER